MNDSMTITTKKIHLQTKGSIDIVNITDKITSLFGESELKEGSLTVFVPGATGSLTTMEYEPGLVSDLKELLLKIIIEGGRYDHNIRHNDGNATSHLRASLLGPSVTVPFEKGKLMLGTYQQVVFIDFDNRPRKRELIVQIIGKK